MGRITTEVWEKYRRERDLIPADILARIDQDEVLDRLDAAHDLYLKADATPSGQLARSYTARARLVCKAEPRADTEAQAQVWLDKAETAHTTEYAAACRENADRIRAENPIAPRRKRADGLSMTDAVAQLQADVRRAAAVEKARQAREDAALLAKVDAAGSDSGVTRTQLAALVRRAVAEALST